MEKDPFIARIGAQIQCKLCLTIHSSQNSYLVHAQGKKHLANVEASKPQPKKPKPKAGITAIERRKFPKIGIPAYKITKVRSDASQLGLLINVKYPQIQPATVPKWRLMSTFEQSREPHDASQQYIVLAAEPYDTIAFKVPHRPLVKDQYWDYFDADSGEYYLQLLFN